MLKILFANGDQAQTKRNIFSAAKQYQWFGILLNQVSFLEQLVIY